MWTPRAANTALLLLAIACVVVSVVGRANDGTLGGTPAPAQGLRGPPPPPAGPVGRATAGFVDQSAYVGLGRRGAARGSVAAVADFNRDRFLDVVLFHAGTLSALQVAFWNHERFLFEPRGSGLHLANVPPEVAVPPPSLESAAANDSATKQQQPPPLSPSRCPLRFIASVAPADFNNDGIVDLLVGDGTTGCVFFGNGEGDFNESVAVVIPELPTSSLILDANADLVPDIFVGFANGTRGFYVFSSAPPPRGGAPRLPHAVTFHPWRSSNTAGIDVGCAVVGGDIALPAFVDLDGDCLADLVVPTTCGLEVWRNPSSVSRTFWELSVKRDTGSFYRFFGPEVFNHVHGDAALVFADFDGDGTIDIGVPNRNRKDLLVFRNVQTERKRGNLCTPDPAWQLKARVGLASGLHLDPGSIGPLFGRINVPTSVHIGDYDLDGLPDLLIIDSSKGIPVIFRNLGHWDSETAAMQPHFAPIADNTALAKAAGSGTAIAALFFDTGEIGRQDIMVIKSRNSTSLVWNTFITKSDSLFFKGTCLSALPYHGPARPFAPVAGNTFKVSYMARTSRHRVTRICSQCSQSGPWSLKPCNCLFGLLQISNYIEEIAVGAGGASRSWTNLMPNSMAVVWAEDTRSASGSLSSADWWMEYFTQRRGGQMLRVVVVLTVALGVLGASILLLQQRERKEDRANESEHVQLFNFGGPL